MDISTTQRALVKMVYRFMQAVAIDMRLVHWLLRQIFLIKELDVKVLVGCTEEEVDQVLRFLNQTNYQKTVLIRKGNELPSWAETDI